MVRLHTMNSSNPLWGELEDPDHSKLNLSPSDRDQLTRIPRPLSLEGPRIHQPKVELLSVSIKPEPGTSSDKKPNESYVTHGVQLLTYINELNKLKEAAIARREKGLPPLSDHQSIPPLPPLSPPNSFPMTKTPFMSYGPQKSLQKLNTLPPLMSSHKAQKALKKSVAVLTAFHGYDLSTDQALDVLTDATSQFLSKFCNLLRHARDRELLNSSKNGFPDILCRVYSEMGLGSILDIRSYYKNSIIAKHKAIGEAAEALAFECHHLDEVQNFSVVENGLMVGEDPDNIPEIHFPSSEEGDNGSSGPPTLSLLDHNAPQIETGLQMLQSLEQYGSLDPGGSVMVTPPPPSAQSGLGEDCEQPMSHDSNAALLLATVSPGSSTGGNSRKRRKTSDNRNVF